MRGLIAKRGPFLGGSAVRLITDVVRGAAGASILLCTVGVDGTIEVVRISEDEGINSNAVQNVQRNDAQYHPYQDQNRTGSRFHDIL